MKIAIRGGHNYGVTGASGFIDELTEDRKYYKVVLDYLQKAGHQVIDVTPERTATQAEDLEYGVSRANAANVDLFISCHLNAGDGHGCEVEYGSSKGQAYGDAICKRLASLGFVNRGAKPDSRGLYELHYTHMPAIIVEPLFVDTQSDVNLYKKIGIDALGKAIAEGIIGHAIANVSTSGAAASTNPVKKTGVVNCDTLNVRSGAGTNFTILGKLNKGDTVKIASCTGDWYSIYYGANGGYVNKAYIS